VDIYFYPPVCLRDVDRDFIYRPVEKLMAFSTNIAWALTTLKNPIHRRSNNEIT